MPIAKHTVFTKMYKSEDLHPFFPRGTYFAINKALADNSAALKLRMSPVSIPQPHERRIGLQ